MSATSTEGERRPQAESDRPLRADARRNHQRILDVAREVFAERGVEAQIDDVAARAGVGVGTVYRHFPTKEALMGELLRQKFRIFADTAQGALGEEGEPFEVLAEVLRRNAEVCARDAAVQHALSGAGDHIWARAEQEREDLMASVQELVARAQQAGTLRANVSAADIPMIMCGVSATMTQNFPGFDWRRHLELAIDMLRAR